MGHLSFVVYASGLIYFSKLGEKAGVTQARSSWCSGDVLEVGQTEGWIWPSDSSPCEVLGRFMRLLSTERWGKSQREIPGVVKSVALRDLLSLQV